MAGFPPRKNEALTIVFPIFGPDGNPLTAAAGLDSERSLDGAGFADCANEAAEIGATGWYSLLLAAGDMNGDVVAVQTKTTTAGAHTACHTFYTQTRAIDDLAFPATAGRSIAVEADGMIHADVKEWLGVAMNALQAGRVDSYTGAMANNVITAAAIAAAAITAVEAPNLDAAVSSRSSHNAAAIWAVAVRDLTALGFNLANTDFAAGAIDANAMAANAIGASEFDQAAADKIWASAARTLTALGFNLAAGDFAAGAVDANALATDAAEEIADALIGRNIAGGSNVGRLVSEALAILRNRRAIAAGLLTVYQADDVTPLWTAPVATAPGDPVVDIDPV